MVCAGHETKSMLNNSGPRAKRSKLERSINIEVGSQVLLLAVLCLIGVMCKWAGTTEWSNGTCIIVPCTHYSNC